jgi:predicted aconitase
MDGRQCRAAAKRAVLSIATITLACVGCVLLSAALVQVPILQGDRSSNAGQAFGAAAAASSTVLLFYMARTMRMQEKESEMQRIVLQNQQRIMEDQCSETRMMKGEIHRTSQFSGMP